MSAVSPTRRPASRARRPAPKPRVRHRGLPPGPTRLVGVAAIVITIAVVLLGVFKPNPFASYEVLRAQFRTARGLGVVGLQVRVAGADVGTIAGVQRQGNHALLTLHLDPSVGTIHQDATAQLRPHLAFEGTAYVDLDPGVRGSPPLRGELPLSQTSVYVPVSQALSVFNPPTRAATRATVRELAPVLTGTGVAGVQSTLRGTPALVRTLAPAAAAAAGPNGTELAGALAGLSRTMAALASRQSQLVPITRQAAATFSAFNPDGGAALGQTLDQLPPALSALDTGGRSLEGIITRLDPLARDLMPGLAVLAPTLRASLPLVSALGPALQRAAPLLDNLRAGLHAGAGAAPATITLLDELQPTLQMLDGSLLPALLAPTKKLHIPAYLSFINLFEGGGGASAPYQTGTEPGEMGTGHFMRFGFRFLTGIGLPLPPCTLLAEVNASLAQALEAAGGCTPP
jgi:ABC-type transporter Mla subunit MlaD